MTKSNSISSICDQDSLLALLHTGMCGRLTHKACRLEYATTYEELNCQHRA